MTFTPEVEQLLHRVAVGALAARHSKLMPEHLALDLIAEPETAAYLRRCGTDLERVESSLRRSLAEADVLRDGAELESTPAFQSIVQTAIKRTEQEGREYLTIRDLLLAVIDAPSTAAGSSILDATSEPSVFEELRTYRSETERRAV